MIKGIHSLGAPRRILYNSVFSRLYAGHGDITALVDNPSQDMLSQVNDALRGPLRRTALTALATQEIYRDRLRLIDMMGAGFSEARYRSMSRCTVPGVTYGPDTERVKCRQYVLCPGCRYRFQVGLFTHLQPLMGPGRRIGVLPLRVPLGEYANSAEAVLALKALVDSIYAKKWRTWLGDATFMVPCYVPKRNMWMAMAVIIAVGTSDNNFWEPSERLGQVTKWYTSPATDTGLARAIAQWSKYSVGLLYTKNTGVSARINRMMTTDTGPVCRMRIHGLSTNTKQKHRQVGKEIHIETNGTGICSGHAPETSDVAEPLRDQEGCIPSTAADSGVLHKESPQFIAGR